MASYLIRKLEHFTRLSTDEKRCLEQVSGLKLRRLNPREDIIDEGDAPVQVNLILEGWACRYKLLEDGRRQIMGYLIPGDVCDMHIFILKEMDHSIGTVSPVTLAEISRDKVIELTAGDSCEIPMPQAELGETLGLSTVHVNRTLQELRASNLVGLRARRSPSRTSGRCARLPCSTPTTFTLTARATTSMPMTIDPGTGRAASRKHPGGPSR